MKRAGLILLLIIHLVPVRSGEGSLKQPGFRFPLSIGLMFQNFALPFRDMKSNFAHPGIFMGSELLLNKRGNLVQQIQLAGYINKETGDGFQLYTQLAYRPRISKHFRPELKAGIGWSRTFHPVQAYRYDQGEWSETAGGKSQLMVPFGIGIEFSRIFSEPYIVPFLDYQLIPELFYNDNIPLSFHNVLQTGVKIYL